LVLHRTFLQSMPLDWQQRMAACLDELHEAFSHIEQPEAFHVEAATGHIVNEMTEVELRQAGITADWYGGQVLPGDTIPGPEFDEWREQHETDEPVYYRDGEELDPHSRVLVPAADPVPHYSRGRTYIEPVIEETHVVADDSDDPEHVDDCPGCEAFTLTGHIAGPHPAP